MSRNVSFIVNGLFGLLLVNSAGAQSTDHLTGHNVWQDRQINEVTNIRSGGLNPTSLSYNEKSTSSFAGIGYRLTRGKFHRIDESGRRNDLNVYFGGLRRIGKVDLSGYLEYINMQADNQRWNATLYLNADNPFIIADSVLSDVTTEAFRMNAAASYRFMPQLKGALSIGLLAGARSDQNDPRPKTGSSVVPISVGMDWTLKGAWSVGLAQSVELYRSRLQYTLVNNLFKYKYFIMKGMGDYYGVSTGSEVSYQRDYSGTRWQTALQGVWRPQENRWSNFVEVSYGFGQQDAEDGGSSYTFKGGKFEYSFIAFRNRLQFRPSENMIHQIILSGNLKQGDGTWSDQKRVVDTEHNNRADYITLSSYKVEKDKVYGGEATYRFDRFREGLPDWHATANVGAGHTLNKHYTDQGWNKQEYTMAHVLLNAGKAFRIGNSKTLSASVGGAYFFPLGDKTFGTGNIAASGDNITAAYVAPMFEYNTSRHFNVKGSVDFKAPVRVKGSPLVVGAFAAAQCNAYADNAEYAACYKSKSLFCVDFGVYLDF